MKREVKHKRSGIPKVYIHTIGLTWGFLCGAIYAKPTQYCGFVWFGWPVFQLGVIGSIFPILNRKFSFFASPLPFMHRRSNAFNNFNRESNNSEI